GEGHGLHPGLQSGELLDELVRDHVSAGGDELAEFDEGDTGGGQGVAGGRGDLTQGYPQGRDPRFEVPGEAELDEDLLDLREPVETPVPGRNLGSVADDRAERARGHDEFDREQDEHLDDDEPGE